MQWQHINLAKSIICTCTLVLLLVSMPEATAETFESIKARKPDLFHDKTGYRISKQRGPTPDNIPAPAKPVTAEEAAVLIEKGALALDVFGALQSRYDELDGTWLVSKKRKSLPGAVWLPEVGRGTLNADIQAYLETELAKLTGEDKQRDIVVFCVADCWMSWNAAQRISALGYENVYWFRHGTDGWLDSGRELQPVDPLPVNVD